MLYVRTGPKKCVVCSSVFWLYAWHVLARQVKQNTITFNAAISACHSLHRKCQLTIIQIYKFHHSDASIIHHSDFKDYFWLYIQLNPTYIQLNPTFSYVLSPQPSILWSFHICCSTIFSTWDPSDPGERGSQWPLALDLLFREMPVLAVPRNIITFSAAISDWVAGLASSNLMMIIVVL